MWFGNGWVDEQQLAPVAGVGLVAVHRVLDHVGVAVGVGVVGVELAPVARERDAEEAPLAAGRDLVADVEHRTGVDRADGLGDHVRLRVGAALDLQALAPCRPARRCRGRRCRTGPSGRRARRARRPRAAVSATWGMAVGPGPAPPSVVGPVAAPPGGRGHGRAVGVRATSPSPQAPVSSASAVTAAARPRRADRRCVVGGSAHRETRRSPSWTTVTARWPSWVKIEPVAVPRPPEADGVSCA